MAVIEIAKIQMRRGPEIDIPGRAVTTSPLAFEPGLDVAEFGYAQDTGRLFIGHSPGSGHANYQRTEFPYQNIEILTEASTETLRRIVSTLSRDVGSGGHYKAVLVGSTPDWSDVLVSRAGAALSYRIPGDSLLAQIDYHIVQADSARTPLRSGTLRVMSDSQSDECVIRDEAVTLRRTDLVTPAAVDPEAAYQNIEFQIVREGPPSDRFFRMQYFNALPVEAILYFTVKRPLSDTSLAFEIAANTTSSNAGVYLDDNNALKTVPTPATNQTGMMLLVNINGSSKVVPVSVGAANSGGPGVRALTVPNDF